MSDSVRAEWRLSVDNEAPGTARGLVRQAVGLELPAERVDALLLVTEVITNAVLHGSPEPDGKIGLRLERDGRTVRIVAIDGGHHSVRSWLSQARNTPGSGYTSSTPSPIGGVCR